VAWEITAALRLMYHPSRTASWKTYQGSFFKITKSLCSRCPARQHKSAILAEPMFLKVVTWALLDNTH
jgi:hypothetical protein